MYRVIRRLSSSIFSRTDRPWADDATSNAPTKGKKRRFSSTEHEQDPAVDEIIRKKKIRGESIASEVPSEVQGTPQPELESSAVKEVTKGVKQVELSEPEQSSAVAPEAVPLPIDDDAGELEEPHVESSPPLDAQADPASDDIASSVDGETGDVAAAIAGVAVPPQTTTVSEEVEVPVVEEEKKMDEDVVSASDKPNETSKKTEAPEPAP